MDRSNSPYCCSSVPATHRHQAARPASVNSQFPHLNLFDDLEAKPIPTSYVEIALEAGHNVVATSRKPEDLPKFKNANDKNYLPVALDVTKRDSVNAAFDEGR